MRRLRSILSAFSVLALLSLLIVFGNRSIGLTAIVAVVGLAASGSLQSTFVSYIASFQLSSEGVIHEGTILIILGPDGPFTGIVTVRDFRISILRNQKGDETLMVANSALATGPTKVLRSWPPWTAEIALQVDPTAPG